MLRGDNIWVCATLFRPVSILTVYIGSEKFDWNEVKIELRDPKLYMRSVEEYTFI